MIKVTVSLQEKKDTFQSVLQYKDKNGKRQYKWKTTGIKIIKGQKRELKKLAEQKAEEIRQSFERELNKDSHRTTDERMYMLFADYMEEWLKSISNIKAKTTIGRL